MLILYHLLAYFLHDLGHTSHTRSRTRSRVTARQHRHILASMIFAFRYEHRCPYATSTSVLLLSRFQSHVTPAVTYAVTLLRKRIIASSGSRSRAIRIIQIAERSLSANRRLLHHPSHPRSRTRPASHLRSHSHYSIALNSFALSGTLVYGLDSSQLIILRTYCAF